MVRADILVSIKNAIERGYSIEQARQSLINSGYSVKEVDESINYLTSGIGNIEIPNQANYFPEQPVQDQNIKQTQIQTKNPAQTQTQTQIPQANYGYDNMQQIQEQFKIPKQKKHFPWKIIILVSLLLILILVFFGMLIFQDTITSTLQKLLVG
ncbi:MAG: hypothetical protein AABW91_01765 [Nanoarchaeota archaeon]